VDRSCLPCRALRWVPAVSAVVSVVAFAPLARSARAQTPTPADSQSESEKAFRSIEWTKGPAKVSVGDHAELKVPEGFAYTASAGAQKLLQLLQNPTNGSELGILTNTKLDWFLLFEFEDIGYVKDADKEKLDAEEILESIRSGNEAGNEARAERGWPPIKIVGWHTKPFYNQATNNLEWCIKGESEGRPIINYNTRILGRRGVMSANLLVGPDALEAALPVLKEVLAGYAFTGGQRYGEWKSGDKVAKYGLSALVVGGAVGVAAKMGLLAKIAASLGKAWKAIIIGLIAIGAGLKKLLTRRKPDEPAPPPQP
jgi:uncharacterized membrane-anchored protein